MDNGYIMDRRELEAKLSQYTKDWKNEDLFALFAECTTCLSSTKNRIQVLEQQGALKRIVGFFNGSNRRFRIEILKKSNETSMLLFEMVRILTHRITMVDDRVDGLQEECIRLHKEILMLQKAQKLFEHRLDEYEIRLSIHEWFALMERRYAGMPNGKKILSIVSDVFELTKGTWKIDRELLEAGLFEKLRLPEQIEAEEFYSFMIEDPAELSLYIKENCEFGGTDNISEYGRVICNINQFYTENPFLIQQANKRKLPPSELCMQEFHEHWSRDIPAMPGILNLCESLLYDLEIAGYLFMLSGDMDFEEGCPKKDVGLLETEGKEQEKYIIVFSAEKLQIISKGKKETEYFQDIGKHNRLLPEQETRLKIKTEELADAEGIIVVPSRYLSGEYDYFGGESIEGNVAFISMADYYMYLWYSKASTMYSHSARHSKRNMVVIEEYDKTIQAREYQVTESGYQACAVADDIRYLRNGKHLLMDLKEKNFFVSMCKEDVDFLVITDHKGQEEKKLSKKGIRIIKAEPSWEAVFDKEQEFAVRAAELLEWSDVYRFCSAEHRFLMQQNKFSWQGMERNIKTVFHARDT